MSDITLGVTPQRPTLIDRLRRYATRTREQRESGFNALELMFVMIVGAILIAFAFNAFSGLRERAYATGAASDARSAVIEVESSVTDTGIYPATTAAFSAIVPETKLSKNNEVGWFYSWSDSGTKYAFCIEHVTGTNEDAAAIYNSVTGKVGMKRGGGCPAVPTSAPDAPTLVIYEAGTWAVPAPTT